MNLSEAAQRLKAVNYALDNIEAKGRKNMDILLGSMQNIDRVIKELEAGMKELEPEFKLEVMPAEEGEPKIE